MELSMDESFERCCRLCAEEQEVTIMIFSAEAEAMLLQNKLQKYLLIEVDEDDKLPKNICLKCCTKLQTVCDFIDIAHKAQTLLLHRSNKLDPYKSEPEDYNDVCHVTQMEVSVDPMIILQNCDTLSPNEENSHEVNCQESIEDVIYLNGCDGENVTIKLIKKGDQMLDSPGGKKEFNFKPFVCEKCNRGFHTELALKNHSWIHISDDNLKKQFRCTTCEESFDHKCGLLDHLKLHRTAGLCQLCGRIFRTEKNLKAHMAVHSSATSKSYTCKVCGRSYNTKSNLKTHSITHSSERPYHCHLCKKSFKRKQDLKFHINQHTGAKPYKCPFCDKSFASSGNCYSHRSRMHPGRHADTKIKRRTDNMKLRSITTNSALTSKQAKSTLVSVKGIYKYKCQHCDHSFMRRDNFTYHMYQHTGEKPFQCTFCIMKFVTRRGLQIHHDREHPTKNRPLALLSKNLLLK